jgi:DNA-binding beta-propeller fold protein YncE
MGMRELPRAHADPPCHARHQPDSVALPQPTVANRNDGTVSIFTISGKTLTAAGKIDFGNPKSGPSGIAFSPDGKMALVSRDGDHKISVLSVDSNKGPGRSPPSATWRMTSKQPKTATGCCNGSAKTGKARDVLRPGSSPADFSFQPLPPCPQRFP